jgi:hypothetical protein
MYAATSRTSLHPDDLNKLLFFILHPNFLYVSDRDFLRAEDPDRQLVAQTVRFLVSYQPDSHLKTDQASLNKAYYALRRGAYGRKWEVTEEKFKLVWRTYRSVSGFHYVNQLLFDRELDVEVRYTDYHDLIDAIVSDVEYLETYFGLSLWAFEQMKKVLYRSALRNVPLPVFPPNLDPIQPRIARTDAKLKQLMKGFAKVRRSY